ncbi:MAG: DNA translocase FtsK, partial [Paenisporosarcina sp.]
MNWLTKAFKKVFSEETIEKEDLIEELEQPTYRESKTPFRFPLISDEERERPEDDESEVDEKEEEYRPLYMHKQWQNQRQNTVVHHAAKSSIEHTTKPMPRDSLQEAKPRITKVPVQSKPFVPTEVPSPIHGFNRPKISPIDDLLAKKNVDEVRKESAATTIVARETVSIKPSESSNKQTEPIIGNQQLAIEKAPVLEIANQAKISPIDELLAKKDANQVVEQTLV